MLHKKAIEHLFSMKKTSQQHSRQEQRQARRFDRSLSVKLLAYINSHGQAFFSSLGRLLRMPFTSMMTIAVLAIAIALAGGFYIIVANMQQLTGSLEASNQISLFLKSDVSRQRSKALADRLAGRHDVHQVRLISKQQALEEFKQYSGFGDALDALQQNPLPDVIQVLPQDVLHDHAGVRQLLTELQEIPEVDFAQLDMQWVKRLQSIMQLARRGVMMLSVLLGLAVLFITGNTIRLELHSRRDEVVIAKLVGATHAFIQRPFLYSGFWYGFFAGVIAWLVVLCMVLLIEQPVERIALLYDGYFQVLFFGFGETLLLLLISTMLGVLGSWLVLNYQLRQLQPQ